MIAEHFKEVAWIALEAVPGALRSCHESWVALLAVSLGVVGCRLTRARVRAVEARGAAGARPVVRAAGRVAGRHAAALGQLAGRLLAAVVLG